MPTFSGGNSGGAAVTQYDYVERTTDLTVTATSAATAAAFIDGASVSFSGTTRVRIDVYVPAMVITIGDSVLLDLWDGSTDLGILAQVQYGGTSGAPQDLVPAFASRWLTPSAAAHTFHVKAWKTGGTAVVHAGAGGAGTYLPAYYRISSA